jgi:hypothetical protein
VRALGSERRNFDHVTALGTTTQWFNIARLVPLLIILIALSNGSRKRLASRPSRLDRPMHCPALCPCMQRRNLRLLRLAFNAFFLVRRRAAC